MITDKPSVRGFSSVCKGLLIFLVFLLSSCSQQGSQEARKSTPRQDDTKDQQEEQLKQAEAEKAREEAAITKSEKMRRLSNEETEEDVAKRRVTENSRCQEDDKIRKIDFIFYTDPISEPLDINNMYGKHQEFMETVKKVGETPAQQGSPPPSEDFSFDGKMMTISKKSVFAPVPEPAFSIELSPGNIKIEHDENQQYLFSGDHQKLTVGGDGSATISGLRSLKVEQAKAQIVVTNLTEATFRGATGDAQLDLKEVNRRVVNKLIIRINGEDIYSRDDIHHYFGFSKDPSITSNTSGLSWEDPNFRQNKLFANYLENFRKCSAAQ